MLLIFELGHQTRSIDFRGLLHCRNTLSDLITLKKILELQCINNSVAFNFTAWRQSFLDPGIATGDDV